MKQMQLWSKYSERAVGDLVIVRIHVDDVATDVRSDRTLYRNKKKAIILGSVDVGSL